VRDRVGVAREKIGVPHEAGGHEQLTGRG
jgi:hypothetical protein